MCRMMEEMCNEAVEKNSVQLFYTMLQRNYPEQQLKADFGITDEILAKYPDLKPKQNE